MPSPCGIRPRECLIFAASVILATIHGVAQANPDPEGPEFHRVGTTLAPSGDPATATGNASATGTGTATGAASGTASAIGSATATASSKTRGSAPPEATVFLFREAEEAYRTRRWDVALDNYRRVVALQPDHAGAWLRIGNLHHRRGQWLAAASAYRKAADRAARDGAAAEPDGAVAGNPSPAAGPRDIQAKALLNLASVNLELAEAALTQAAALSRASTDQAPAGEAIAEQARRLADRLQGRLATPTGPSGPTVATGPSGPSGPTGPTGPTGSSRPHASTSTVHEIQPPGSLRSAGSATPVIEYLHGAPSR